MDDSKCLIGVVEVTEATLTENAVELSVVVASDLTRSRRRTRVPRVTVWTPVATDLSHEQVTAASVDLNELWLQWCPQEDLRKVTSLGNSLLMC